MDLTCNRAERCDQLTGSTLNKHWCCFGRTHTAAFARKTLWRSQYFCQKKHSCLGIKDLLLVASHQISIILLLPLNFSKPGKWVTTWDKERRIHLDGGTNRFHTKSDSYFDTLLLYYFTFLKEVMTSLDSVSILMRWYHSMPTSSWHCGTFIINMADSGRSCQRGCYNTKPEKAVRRNVWQLEINNANMCCGQSTVWWQPTLMAAFVMLINLSNLYISWRHICQQSADSREVSREIEIIDL